MRDLPRASTSRTLAALIVFALCVHLAHGGARVSVSLYALHLGGSALTVGLLMSMISLVPALTAIPLGRLVDRIGVHRPMMLGAALVALGASVPIWLPGIPALFLTVALTSGGYIAWQVALQNWLGAVAPAAHRPAWFSYLAFGISISGTIGPIVAGLAIDHLGHRGAFAVLMLFPLLAVLGVSRLTVALPTRAQTHIDRNAHLLDLLRDSALLRIFLASGAINVAWDLHTLVVPLLGHEKGYSATQIGFVLGCFGAATLAVRAAIPRLSRRFSEWDLIRAAFVAGVVAYGLYPFAPSIAAMTALSFVLGLGLGASQPNMLSLLHETAPAGRAAEAVGLRMSFVNATGLLMPMVFGAAGTALGVAPLFWSMAAVLGAGRWALHRAH